MNTLDHLRVTGTGYPGGPSAPAGSPEQVRRGNGPGNRRGDNRVADGPSFAQVLQRQLGPATAERPLVFSGHARDRLAARRINLGPQQLARLTAGVDRAAGKGARDSLVLLDDLAFVVNVKNRTVITAVAGSSTREGVFTEIDSAVIA